MRGKFCRKGLPAVLLCVAMTVSLTGCGGGSMEAMSERLAEPDSMYAEVRNADIPRAQDDFYAYVNKQEILSRELTYKEPSSRNLAAAGDLVEKEIDEMLHAIIDSSDKYESGSNEQLVRETYKQALSFVERGDLGAEAEFFETVKKIKAVSGLAELREVVKSVCEYGILFLYPLQPFQDIYAGQGNTLLLAQLDAVSGIPMRDIYEKDDMRRALQANAMNVLVLSGLSPQEARDRADAYVYAAIDIAKETDFSISDVNIFSTFSPRTEEEMSRLLVNTPLDVLVDMNGYYLTGRNWIIQDEGQIRAIDALFTEENIEVLKTWLLCEVLNIYAPFLAREHEAINFGVVSMEDEPEEQALDYTKYLLDTQVSELYAKYYYTQQMDDDIHRMFEDIRASYDDLISGADWLSEKTRERLIKKLYNIEYVSEFSKVREPDVANQALIGGSFFETYKNARIQGKQEQIDMLGKKTDRMLATNDSTQINASYNPVLNVFYVNTAILHAPCYDPSDDYYTNLGGIGFVLAHEVGHAFDSAGILIDENCRYSPDTIPAEDMERLNSNLEKMEAYFSEFTVMSVYHINGKKTSGENYADKGAMECLMHMNMTDGQRKALLEKWANCWQSTMEQSYLLYYLENDVHSPDLARVNAIISSTPEFYELYDVKEGDGMYVAPENRVNRW